MCVICAPCKTHVNEKRQRISRHLFFYYFNMFPIRGATAEVDDRVDYMQSQVRKWPCKPMITFTAQRKC